jgi:hypothetical protein
MSTGDYIGISFTGMIKSASSTAPKRGRAAIGAKSMNGASGMDLVFMTRNAGDGTQLGSADVKMTIESTGDVGIGTDSPDYILNTEGLGTQRIVVDCSNNSTSGVYFRVYNSGSLVGNGTIATQNNGDMKFFTGTSSEAVRMTLAAGGALTLTSHLRMPAGGNASDPLITTSADTNTGIYFPGSGVTGVGGTGGLLVENDVVAYSDRKLKKNIKTLDGSKVYDMRGVSFTRKDTEKDGSGIIAQELQKIAPELVSEVDGTLGIAYGNVTGYLIEAIKDLKAEVEELKNHKCDGCTK